MRRVGGHKVWSVVLGAPALLLAAVGVYGAVTHALVRRTRETAVRIALGAESRGIFGLAVGDTGTWTAVGLWRA